jgi:ABC-type dipeptide/oligopeptide/nickel transport system permease component
VIRPTGDPVTLLAEPGAREDLDRIRTEWGLDRPWPVQYLAFAKNVITGQLGKSFNYEMPVSTLYFQRLPNSLELALAATLISFFIGIPAGIISAVRVNNWWDSFGKIVALLGLSIPGFWLGLVMILVFSVWLEWLPTSGQGDWRNLVMPAVARRHLRGTQQRRRRTPAHPANCPPDPPLSSGPIRPRGLPVGSPPTR